jgi:hypothetical protein
MDGTGAPQCGPAVLALHAGGRRRRLAPIKGAAGKPAVASLLDAPQAGPMRRRHTCIAASLN